MPSSVGNSLILFAIVLAIVGAPAAAVPAVLGLLWELGVFVASGIDW